MKFVVIHKEICVKSRHAAVIFFSKPQNKGGVIVADKSCDRKIPSAERGEKQEVRPFII